MPPATPDTYLASAVHGLEWVAAAEIAQRSGTGDDVDLARRRISFTSADPTDLLQLRTVDDVFALVGTVRGLEAESADLDRLSSAAFQLDWLTSLQPLQAVRRLSSQPTFDVVASVEGSRPYNRFEVEAAIGTSLVRLFGWTFLVRTAAGRAPGTPQLTVRAFVEGDRTVLALRLGPSPLHRRAYKRATAKATLHPPMAAALVRLSRLGDDPLDAAALLDPFCGDGTIAIEAALAQPGLPVFASDVDGTRLANTRANAVAADVELHASLADAGRLDPTDLPPIGALVTNPPWHRTVAAKGVLAPDLGPFWDLAPELLSPAGVLCCIADEGSGVAGRLAARGWQLGLRQGVRLAGRLATVILAGPPSSVVPALAPDLAVWRDRAKRAGVVTDTGF